MQHPFTRSKIEIKIVRLDPLINIKKNNNNLKKNKRSLNSALSNRVEGQAVEFKLHDRNQLTLFSHCEKCPVSRHLRGTLAL